MHFSRKEYRKINMQLVLTWLGCFATVISGATLTMVFSEEGAMLFLVAAVFAFAGLLSMSIKLWRKREALVDLREVLLDFYVLLGIEFKYAQGALRDTDVRMIQLMVADGTITLWRAGIDGYHVTFDTAQVVGEIFVQRHLVDGRGEAPLEVTRAAIERWRAMVDHGVVIEPSITR